MKRVVLFIAAVVAFLGCGRNPRMIPEDVLKDMIEDIMITEAVMGQIKTVSYTDSTDYYRPVLDKYGYELMDVEYTLRQLASRQSKPLSNIYDLIQADLNDMAAVVKYNYARREALDNLAMLCYTDTLFTKYDTLVGKTGDFKAVILNPVKGKYHFSFMYQGVQEYNIPLREVVSQLSFIDKSRSSVKQNNWVSRSFQPNRIRLTVSVPDSVSYDSLVFRINDPDYSGSRFSMKGDTSRSYDFNVVYIPERTDARKAFFKKLTGMDVTLSISRDSSLYDLIKTDSCAVWPLPGR